jgi:hypothetical protein
MMSPPPNFIDIIWVKPDEEQMDLVVGKQQRQRRQQQQ